jgi:hypothetical protein
MGRRAAPTGFTREGKTQAFLCGRDAAAQKVFPAASRDHEQRRAAAQPLLNRIHGVPGKNIF